MKYIICLTLAVSFLLSFSPEISEAASKKYRKSSNKIARSSKKNKGRKGKINKTSRYKRVKKSGNGLDLKALTTTSPYTENPDNGVNSVEAKPGI